MNPATTTVRELSRRLIALEAACAPVSDAGESLSMRVCEKLRNSLVKFAGINGYRTLVSRALSMAKLEAPWLEPVKVRGDGSLEGFDGICESQETDPADIVLVHLLSLLVTFIGERQTLALVSDGWPDGAADNAQLKTKGQQ
jgi:hypothetical protein